MSDGWAKKYVEDHEQERQEKRHKEQEAQTRRSYADAGAPDKFHMLRARIAQDIQTLREDVTFQALRIQDFPHGKFAVVNDSLPRVELSLELKITMITCDYVFHVQAGGHPKTESRTLRICADLDGNLTIYKNGGSDDFTDESDVSEFLLLPVLKHIQG
jgi:hypothetical protein